MNEVNSRWDELSLGLNDREQKLLRAHDVSGDFKEKQKLLKNWVIDATQKVEHLMNKPASSENAESRMTEIRVINFWNTNFLSFFVGIG